MDVPKRKSHGIERKRSYGGEEYCHELLQWLNSPENDEGRGRVRELLQLYRYLDTGWKLVPSRDRRGRLRVNTRGDFWAVYQRLHSLCTRYAYYPSFSPRGRGAEFDPDWHQPTRGFVMANPEDFSETLAWLPLSAAGPNSWGWMNPEYDEMKAVYHLSLIAQNGFLDRLKKCHCGKWLYARFAHQRFCGAKCREQAFRSSPEEKEKRRKWARKYYWLQKHANVK